MFRVLITTMRGLVIALLALFAAGAHGLQPSRAALSQSRPRTARAMINPLDGMNNEMAKQLADEEDAPMTKAEIKEAAKEMKAEMARLKAEAAAAEKAAADAKAAE